MKYSQLESGENIWFDLVQQLKSRIRKPHHAHFMALGITQQTNYV